MGHQILTDKRLLLEALIYTSAPVVQKLDSAIHRMNHFPADKY